MSASNPTTFTSLGIETANSNPHITQPMIGTATLVAGTVSVANTLLTANDLVFLVRTVVGGTIGDLHSAVTAGTGFAITSSNNLDTSTVGYVIIRQN